MSDEPTAQQHVIVGIGTFRRVDQLHAAVAGVIPQCLQLTGSLPAVSASVLVIDNDPEAGAMASCPAGVRYVHEPTPGIAAVRNRALAEARAVGAFAVVFIDDDEVPEPGWLQRLVARLIDSGADAVAGRVETVFPPDIDPWIQASGAFARPIRVDGQRLTEAATNNLAVRLDSLDRLGLAFDERFGLTGGSDSLLTAQLTASGGTIVWCQEAVVLDMIPAERFTRHWILRRHFRFGNTWSRVRVALATSTAGRSAQRVRALGHGVARVLTGAVLWGTGLVSRSLSGRARGAIRIARGLGNITGACGYVHNEYGQRRKAMGL